MANKDYLNKYRRRMDINGCTSSESETIETRETFNYMIDNKAVPTVHDAILVERDEVGIKTNGRLLTMNVTDTSKNDQKVNDEKYFDFKWDEGVKIGDEIYWDETWWIIYHQERNSVMSHRTFTAKKCNYNYVFEYGDSKFTFPVLLMNLTLYSDGMNDKTYITSQDGSRRITISNNSISEKIKVGTRIMLTHETVFEVAHIDDFSREGVKDLMLSQVFVTSLDDLENNIAYNNFEELDDADDIVGSDTIYIGGREIYTTKIQQYSRWEVVAEDNCVYVDTSYSGCKLICINDIEYIGTKITLNLIRYGEPIASKEITIKGMF